MGNFYVYILSYPDGGEPFYIGKGIGRRYKSHFIEAKNGDNNLKCNIIRKIWKNNSEPTIAFIAKDLDEQLAFDMEIFYIKTIGRRDQNMGTLANHTDGGEGSAGYKHTPEAILKIRESQIGKIISEERKQELREIMLSDKNPMKNKEVLDKVSGENHWAYGKVSKLKGKPMHTEETKQRLREMNSGENNPNYGIKFTEERLAQHSKCLTGIKRSNTDNFHWERKKITCPHCGKVGSVANMKRWHFDNCKENSNA